MPKQPGPQTVFGLKNGRVQVMPSPTKPGFHTQVPPVHTAFGLHVCDVDACLWVSKAQTTGGRR